MGLMGARGKASSSSPPIGETKCWKRAYPKTMALAFRSKGMRARFPVRLDRTKTIESEASTETSMLADKGANRNPLRVRYGVVAPRCVGTSTREGELRRVGKSV